MFMIVKVKNSPFNVCSLLGFPFYISVFIFFFYSTPTIYQLMGIYLTQPNKTKRINSETSIEKNIKFFSCQMQGWRRQMEDACLCEMDVQNGNSLFAVFDGHGGPEVSQFVKENYINVLKDCKLYQEGLYPEALASICFKLDQRINSLDGEKRLKEIHQERIAKQSEKNQRENKKKKRKPSECVTSSQTYFRKTTRNLLNPNYLQPLHSLSSGALVSSKSPRQYKSQRKKLIYQRQQQIEQSKQICSPTINRQKSKQAKASKIGEKVGCTANIVLITKDKIFVSNTGDSRSILCRKNKGYSLSFDHKPNNPLQYERIIKAGSTVTNGRINNGLNVSRTLGDFAYKQVKDKTRIEQPVICLPEVRCIEKSSQDEFLLIGCDGIFEKYYEDQQQLIDFIRKGRKNNKSGTEILANLFEKMIAKSTDQVIGCDNMSAILLEFI